MECAYFCSNELPVTDIQKHGIDGFFLADSKNMSGKSVFFKFNSMITALKETLLRRLIYKDRENCSS